jgi:hypothetical protein
LVLISHRKATSERKLKRAYREAEKAERRFMKKFLRNMTTRSKTPEALLKRVAISNKRRTCCQKVSERKLTSFNQ